VGILRDVSTERRRERELHYKTRVMNGAPIGITMSDPSRPDDPVSYVSDRFVEMTGYDREATPDRNCRFLRGPDTVAEPVDDLRAAIEAGEPATATLRTSRRDGEAFWVRTSLAPLCGEDGEVERWVGFQEDVTGSETYRRRLERRNARLERFAHALSHDLRNPLTVAQGRLERVRDAVDSEDLDAVAGAHSRIGTLIDDLLALVDAADEAVDTEPVSLATAAEACWAALETGAATIRIESDRTLRADPRRFRRLLTNLLGNTPGNDSASPRATSPADAAGSPCVTVGGTEDGFYVADGGTGTSTDDRLFELGDSTGREAGFGLSIVDDFAAVHGWTVCVWAGERGGTGFEVVGIAPDGSPDSDADTG
jgi:PAS domain S-box-containing protein